ncbi:hypothetical protein HWV62_31881 [Athelia sp. TMB]|nr:hypothetical protein HWV62_31881 [Athelia sp. TMB]
MDAQATLNEELGEGNSCPTPVGRESQTFSTSNIYGGRIFNIAGDHISHISEIGTNARLDSIEERLSVIYDQTMAPDASSNYNAARAKHHPQTCNWFINGMPFSKWKNMPGRILVIYGAPGCGKTILCSSIIEHIQGLCNSNSLSGYAYFFFDSRDSNQALTRYENLLKSVVSQLGYRCGGVPAALRDMYRAHGSGREHPSIKSLYDTLQIVVEGFDHFYIIVDSLDECGDRLELLGCIRALASWNSKRLHILFTSRPEPDIERQLSLLPPIDHLRIDGKMSRIDIMIYLDQRLLSMNRWDEKTSHLIKTTLAERADGMFRWVALQMDDLQHCLNPREVKRQLEALPKDLEAAYERILSRCSRPRDLLQMLHWLAFSTRALTLEEIAEVVSVDLDAACGPSYDPDLRYGDPTIAVAVCSGLVTGTQARGHPMASSIFPGRVVPHLSATSIIVKLAHFSVKEYLISNRMAAGATAFFGISARISHSVIVQTCLAYLLHFNATDSITRDHLHSYPLSLYAAEHWADHYRSMDYTTSSIPEDLVVQLFGPASSCALINWLRLRNPDHPLEKYNSDESIISPAHPLYYASLLGIKPVVEYFLEQGVDPDTPGGRLGTPLQAASLRGHEQIVNLLLDHNADATIQAGEFGTALCAAILHNHIQIVELLLDRDAPINAHSQNKWGFTALHFAALSGHATIVQLLLQQGADVDAVDDDGHTAFYYAAQNGRDILCEAASAGHSEIVERLLDCGADPNARSTNGDGALFEASSAGHTEIVKLLLRRGADVNVRNDHGYHPLSEASFQGHIDIVNLLLEHGADVHAPNGLGYVALSEAASEGHTEIVRSLLDWGADVNDQDGCGYNALSEASSKGHTRTVKLLLERGADIGARSIRGETALWHSILNNHTETVKLLLDWEAMQTHE